MNSQLSRALSRRPALVRELTGARRSTAAAAAVDLAAMPVWTRWISNETPRGWATHVHEVHELIWGGAGTIAVRSGQDLWLVPAMAGLWIPAGTAHSVLASGNSAFACTFVDPVIAQDRQGPALVEVSALSREALRRLGDDDFDPEVRDRLSRVALDFIGPTLGAAALRLPTDSRARAVAEGLLSDPADDRPLRDWARQVHTSERTLSRLYAEQTGLSLGRWRTEVRVRRAMDLLARGGTVEAVSVQVGYRSVSAFSTSFRSAVGQSPGTFGRRWVPRELS